MYPQISQIITDAEEKAAALVLKSVPQSIQIFASREELT
jgi:hypothetical protein